MRECCWETMLILRIKDWELKIQKGLWEFEAPIRRFIPSHGGGRSAQCFDRQWNWLLWNLHLYPWLSFLIYTILFFCKGHFCNKKISLLYDPWSCSKLDRCTSFTTLAIQILIRFNKIKSIYILNLIKKYNNPYIGFD